MICSIVCRYNLSYQHQHEVGKCEIASRCNFFFFQSLCITILVDAVWFSCGSGKFRGVDFISESHTIRIIFGETVLSIHYFILFWNEHSTCQFFRSKVHVNSRLLECEGRGECYCNGRMGQRGGRVGGWHYMQFNAHIDSYRFIDS